MIFVTLGMVQSLVCVYPNYFPIFHFSSRFPKKKQLQAERFAKSILNPYRINMEHLRNLSRRRNDQINPVVFDASVCNLVGCLVDGSIDRTIDCFEVLNRVWSYTYDTNFQEKFRNLCKWLCLSCYLFKTVCSRDYDWFKICIRISTFSMFLSFSSSVFYSNCCCAWFLFIYSYSCAHTHTGSFLFSCPNTAAAAALAAECRKSTNLFFEYTVPYYICLVNLLLRIW